MSFDIARYAQMMARYNQWMNHNLYEAASKLSDEQRKRDQGLFFRSIHGTLNHLLLADTIWLGRFLEQPFAAKSLDQELHANFAILRHQRQATDSRISDWANALSGRTLPARLIYTSMNGQARDLDYAQAIVHSFNHQTHHRGQITAALSQTGVDFGVTDLIYMPAPV